MYMCQLWKPITEHLYTEQEKPLDLQWKTSAYPQIIKCDIHDITNKYMSTNLLPLNMKVALILTFQSHQRSNLMEPLDSPYTISLITYLSLTVTYGLTRLLSVIKDFKISVTLILTYQGYFRSNVMAPMDSPYN